MTNVDLAIRGAEQITFQTAIGVCSSLAELSGQSEDSKRGCLQCALTLRVMLNKQQAIWGILNGE